MHDAGDCYEYIVVYVDDLIIAMKDPKEFFDQLQASPVNFKLKGVGPASYYLGGDLLCDDDGTLCFGSQTYQNDSFPISNHYSTRIPNHLLALWTMKIDPNLTLLSYVDPTTLPNSNL